MRQQGVMARLSLSFPLAFLALLGATSCSSGPTILTHDNGEVALRVESGVDEVAVENMKVRKRDGRATAQFHLVNDGDEVRRVFVSLEWFDADGFLLDDSMEVDPRERTFTLRGENARTLTFFSPDGGSPSKLRCVIEPVDL